MEVVSLFKVWFNYYFVNAFLQIVLEMFFRRIIGLEMAASSILSSVYQRDFKIFFF